MADSFSIPVSPILKGKKAVICDDEAITFMHMARALEKAGAQVIGSASDGQEAVKVIRKLKPDLVTMDIQMPFMNGIDAIPRVLAEHDTCIVVVSAYASDETRRKSREAGACAFVNKPINVAEFIRTLEEAVQSHAGMGEEAEKAVA